VAFRDLFSRRPAPQPTSDNLPAILQAAPILLSELDLVPSGEAGICLKPVASNNTADSPPGVTELLKDLIDTSNVTTDGLGFSWILFKNADLPELETKVHQVHDAIAGSDAKARLLCTVFGFVPKVLPGEGSVRMVYLTRQATWYPFAPVSASARNNELELRVKAFLSDSVPLESDLSRWMALWGLPVS